MVQIHACVILKPPSNNKSGEKPIILSSHVVSNSWVTWFYSDTLREFTSFFSKLLCEKTQPGMRQQVEKDEMFGYVHKRQDGLTAVLITDKDYPVRVAFDIVRKVLYDFSDYLKQQNISPLQLNKEQCVSSYNNTLKDLVTKGQDPTSVDSMLKLKKDIEETKEVLHQALEKLLDRGDTIDNLISRSEELSDSSKEFYRKARQSKCPCTIL